MTPDEALAFCSAAYDGQEIRVTTASGRVFKGFYSDKSDPDTFLYFETLEGGDLKAEWAKVTELAALSTRAAVGKVMIPPEHPLSGTPIQGPRPYTTRNPR